MTAPPLDPQTQAWVLTFYRWGRSVNRIARELGIAWKTARLCLIRWGVYKAPRGGKQ